MVIFIQVTYLIFQIIVKWLEHMRNISQDTDMFQWKKENIMEEFPSCEVLNSWNSDDSVLWTFFLFTLGKYLEAIILGDPRRVFF